MRYMFMNYKDALTHPINERLTKAKLIEISNALQDHCLVNELTVIPMRKYYLDIRNRWQIHVNESRLFIKDIMKLGAMTREGWEYIYKMYWLFQLERVMKIK